MKRLIKFILAILLIVLCTSISTAQIPRTLSYQGVLTDSSGNPKPDGMYTFTFRFYDVATGGAALWTEIKDLQIKRGLFSTTLGDISSFTPPVTFDKPYWLGIKPGSEPELSPRISFSSVAYSLNSLKSDTAQYARTTPSQMYVDSARIAGTISDNTITTNKIVNGTIQREDVVPNFTAPYSDTAAYARVAPQAGFVDSARVAATIPDGIVTTSKIGNNAVTSGKIASGQVVKSINTLKDDVTLAAGANVTITPSGGTLTIASSGGGNVNGTGAASQVPFWTGTSSMSGDDGLVWDNTNKRLGVGTTSPLYPLDISTGANIGIRAIMSSTSGYGIYGVATATTGSTYAVGGNNSSSNGIGVYGYASSTTGGNYGVFAESKGSTGRGVSGLASSTDGVAYGVYGESNSSAGTGVFGFASSTTGTNYGLSGRSNSSGGIGVHALASSTTGITYGVIAQSSSSSGMGVYALASAASGNTLGLYGVSLSFDGTGVYGNAPSTTGFAVGVYGRSMSSDGKGVYGNAPSTTGTTYGVYGTSSSSSGTGVRGHSPFFGTKIISGANGIL
ncbi:MAG: hypothetical protein QME58_06745, partial [Bacteroidota bacterium]|nr:hypothetical protein [Bacteroidota bacterium]